MSGWGHCTERDTATEAGTSKRSALGTNNNGLDFEEAAGLPAVHQNVDRALSELVHEVHEEGEGGVGALSRGTAFTTPERRLAGRFYFAFGFVSLHFDARPS